MKKPELCLALSVSVAFAQANLLPARSESTSPTIWQKLAGTATGSAAVKTYPAGAKKTKSTSRVMHRVASSELATVSGVAASAANGHAMLFLKNKESGTSAASAGPAAALTIHPSLPLEMAQQESVLGASTQDKPTLVAMNDLSSGMPASHTDSKQLLAQLSPDQLIAQGDAGTTTVTPIPPVVSGTVDLEEFKASNVIDLKVSQSRTFKLRNKIVRTSISDPSIAEPVVVAENQLVLLGKAPGGATLVIWDDAGNSVAVDLRVTRDYSSLQAMLREIDPRIIVKPFSVGGGDRVILLGDVDHPESVIRAFSAANAFMDDRGMQIVAANSRILAAKVGEQGASTGGGGGGSGGGQLAQLARVDTFTYFANTNNNVGKAQVMISDGGRVTSLIKVRKTPLIVLHCTFMEMSTAAARELGVQLGLNFTTSSFGFGVGGQNFAGTGNILLSTVPGISGGVVAAGAGTRAGYTDQPVSFTAANVVSTLLGNTIVNLPISAIGQGVLNALPAALVSQSVLLGAPGGVTFLGGQLANIFSGISNFASNDRYRWSINPTVQGVVAHSRARVLAEPTLVTISGERAAFLAGGEIPILQSIATAGQSQQSVVFEPFGVRLNMIPVLLENGSINLQIAPEERIVSNTNQLNIPFSTTNVPGFTTRKSQTIVEMKPGQELFISGMITANVGREITKTPLLGEIPVLGALYRSKAFNKNESELVVAVRPEVILPGTPGQMKLPEEISRVEGPRDTNLFQVEPTVIDERYMTSGRAERDFKIPGTLPAGSPIPDSQ